MIRGVPDRHPEQPLLVGYSLPTQWLQLDLASGAVMRLTTSAAGMVVVHGSMGFRDGASVVGRDPPLGRP